VPDAPPVLAGPGGLLALSTALLAARSLLARRIPPESPARSIAPGLPDLEAIAAQVARCATLPQVEELLVARVATLRADFNAIAESVDSNLEAIDRTRRRVAARRQDLGTSPAPAPAISPAALAYLQGQGRH